MSNHKSVVRNEGYVRKVVAHIERHNERKNENYGNIDVVLEQSHRNIHYKVCDGTYLGVFDKMIEDGEISTRGLKLTNEGKKPESSIIAEMIFDVNTEYFEEQYERHGYANAYDFAKAFYADAYKMAVNEVGDEKYILSAVLHADERNKGLSEKLGRDVYHYHLHATYIPVVRKEILWTKRCKDPALVGTVKEVINQVNHSKKWESEKEIGEDGKERIIYSYSKLQDRYHDHMKVAGYDGFERGKEGSTAQHLSVLEFKAKMRQEELTEKIAKLELTNIEFGELESALENIRADKQHLQAEKDELQTERDKLQKEVAPIKDLQKLKTKTAEIKIPDKPPAFGNAKIPYEDLVKLKEMADTYIANEAEIKDIRKRRVAVVKREETATEKEKGLAAREKNLAGKEGALAEAAQIKSERDRFKTQSGEQAKQITALTTDTNTLRMKLKTAYEAIEKIIKAARLLKYASGASAEYKIENLTEKQGILLDALAHFGAKLADKNNFSEQAEQMRKFIHLDEGIETEMKILAPHLYPVSAKNNEQNYMDIYERLKKSSEGKYETHASPPKKSRSHSYDER